MAAAPAAAKAAVSVGTSPRGRRIAATVVGGCAAGLLVLLLLLTTLISTLLGGPAGLGSDLASPAASEQAASDIPGEYLALYQRAGAARGIDWAVLAGIGKLECNHGRAELDGCNPPGTVNRAGARGPMQFLGSTWRASAPTFDPDVAGPAIPEGQESRGYATDGDGDGVADPWEPADAIHAAARHLVRNGAPASYETALRAYNPSTSYVQDVLDWADRYRANVEDIQLVGAGGDVPLTDVDCPRGASTTVHAQIAPAVTALYAAAADAGHLLCGGGYRSPNDQINLRRNNCGTSEHAIYEMPAAQCSPPTAPPGSSMHERGLAIDLTCNGSLIETRTNPCFQWLTDNADDYGLENLPSEPWHFSTDGS